MQPSPNPLRFLAYDELKRFVPYTRQHLGRMERAGLFPKRVQIGPNKVAWREDEVRAWGEARSAERGEAA